MECEKPPVILGSEARLEAVRAVEELLGRLKLESAFLGGVAQAAWLGEPLDAGSIDVVAMVSPERCQQIPMMAANNGFEVDPEEVESARELDLVPMRRIVGETVIRIHVLMATTAIYTKMIRQGVEVMAGDRLVRVIRPADLLLLLLIDDCPEARARASRLVESMGGTFERDEFNRRLVSIGLRAKEVRP